MKSIAPPAAASSLLVAAALLLTTASAVASPPGASVVLDQPDGFTDPLTGAGGHNTLGLRRSVSADGRYVAFVSQSDGLSGADDDRFDHVYRKDRVTGDVALVSVAPDGRGGNGHSYDPAISADGGRIVFVSNATNLDPTAVSAEAHVFVRDVAANDTFVASRATGAAGVAVPASAGAISGDGRVVAFSTSERVDPQDKNGAFDIYARRLVTGETLLVSRRDGADGTLADRQAFEPSVNGDGSRIVFTSEGSLEAADANGLLDVYRRDVTTATTDLISQADGGDPKAGNGASQHPSISASGNAVAFVSTASNLDGSVLDDASGRADVFVAVGSDQHQLSPLQSGHLTRASATPSIAGDPGPVRVAFETTLAADPPRAQVVVHTLPTGEVEIASATASGGASGAASGQPSIAADGRVVAFTTVAADLGAESGGDWGDVVARDLDADRTDLVSAPATGPLSEDLEEVSVRQGGGQLSPDARYATFTAGHDGLGVIDRRSHVFLRDAQTGRTVLVDRADGPGGAPASDAHSGSASADGRVVAFVTRASLTAADENAHADVYVRDTVAGTTQLVSRTPSGPAGNGDSFEPVVSADGRRVAFHTSANLDPGDTDRDADVYVADLATGDRVLASRAAAPANGPAYGAALSADGSRVAFTSTATNLDPADTDTSADVFVRDLGAGTTTLVSRRNDGGKETRSSFRSSISANGRRVAFQSEAALADDSGATSDVYVRDVAAGTTTLVSRASGAMGAKGDGASDFPTISADGSAVAFRSYAGNLGGEEGGVYVRRLADATTTAMGFGRAAGLSADGACLMMTTASPALIRSSPDYERVLLRAVRASCALPEAPVGAPSPSGPAGPAGPVGPPQLSGLSLSRTRFSVGARRTAKVARVRRGSIVRFRLDRKAQVRLTIQRRVGKRWVARGTLRRSGRAGANRVPFSGRVGRRALKPGRYRFVARASDAAGTSAPRQLAFRIARKR